MAFATRRFWFDRRRVPQPPALPGDIHINGSA